MKATAAAVFAALPLLSACVAVPRTVSLYDPQCQAIARQIVLDEVQVGAIAGCSNQGCVALIVGASVVSAASYVISGTIAIVGNIAYWVERRAQCMAPSSPGGAPPAQSATPSPVEASAAP